VADIEMTVVAAVIVIAIIEPGKLSHIEMASFASQRVAAKRFSMDLTGEDGTAFRHWPR